jgi:hypothetical protein
MENKRRNFTKPAPETDGTVIVGRNPIMELLKSGKDVEKRVEQAYAISKEYSYEKTVQEYVKIYKTLLK